MNVVGMRGESVSRATVQERRETGARRVEVKPSRREETTGAGEAKKQTNLKSMYAKDRRK